MDSACNVLIINQIKGQLRVPATCVNCKTNKIKFIKNHEEENTQTTNELTKGELLLKLKKFTLRLRRSVIGK